LVFAIFLIFKVIQTDEIKKQNLENFYPRFKRTGHYKIFSFGSGFALFMEPTQQAAGYSDPQNKIFPLLCVSPDGFIRLDYNDRYNLVIRIE